MSEVDLPAVRRALHDAAFSVLRTGTREPWSIQQNEAQVRSVMSASLMGEEIPGTMPEFASRLVLPDRENLKPRVKLIMQTEEKYAKYMELMEVVDNVRSREERCAKFRATLMKHMPDLRQSVGPSPILQESLHFTCRCLSFCHSSVHSCLLAIHNANLPDFRQNFRDGDGGVEAQTRCPQHRSWRRPGTLLPASSSRPCCRSHTTLALPPRSLHPNDLLFHASKSSNNARGQNGPVSLESESEKLALFAATSVQPVALPQSSDVFALRSAVLRPGVCRSQALRVVLSAALKSSGAEPTREVKSEWEMGLPRGSELVGQEAPEKKEEEEAVSYTHLTLPTICSV
eukprot:2068010-Rhodomonas_salina.2